MRDILAVIEEQDVNLYMESAPDSGLMGAFYFSTSLGPCIFVNRGVTEIRVNFTAAHEYCHFLVDREALGSYACLRPRETASRPTHKIRANSFAAAFLMPREAVESLVRRYGVDGVEDIVYLQHYFGTSYDDAVLWRLRNLDLVDEEKRERLAKAKHTVASRKLGDKEDALAGEQVAGEMTRTLGRRFRRLALEAFRGGKISGGKLAELLGLSRQETLELAAEMGDDLAAPVAL